MQPFDRIIDHLLRRGGPRSAGDPDPAVPGDLKHVHLLDTAIASTNIGDEIIVEAARAYIEPALASAYVSSSASHDGLGPSSYELAKSADYVLLLGSNALAPFYQLERPFIWHVDPAHVNAMKGKLILVGVGANTRFDKVDPRQKTLLRKLLAPNVPHSVRDAPAARIVEECGFKALNTSCPTLWQFAWQSPEAPETKADSVTFTLTRHKPSRHDADFVQILKQHYSAVYFWPQQPRDLDYLRELISIDWIKLLPPSLRAYDLHLANVQTDVIGTRLHGSIRGLQHGRRTIIVSIDNRAEDMCKETGLVSIVREEISSVLPNLIYRKFSNNPASPRNEIEGYLASLKRVLD